MMKDYPYFFIQKWILLYLLFVKCIQGFVEVNISNLAYSYVMNIEINNSPYTTIVDTGMAYLTVYNRSVNATLFAKYKCLPLTLDGTSLNYYTNSTRQCNLDIEQTLQVQSIIAENISVLNTVTFKASNPILHNWKNSSGDFGLSYYSNGKYLLFSTFQSLLSSSTAQNSEDYNNQTFGLNFHNPSSSILSIASGGSSSMQLGGVLPKYANSIIWQQQPLSTPSGHEFFLDSLSFCGVNLFANYSNNWQVLVDTGSSCLTLPGEMYDTFSSWYSNTTVTNARQLPAVSFTLNGHHDTTYYIPLGQLLVAENAIKNEPGAPYVHIGSNVQRICVLRGNDIEDNSGNYNSPAPNIVFGSLVLQSIYFAANFQQHSIGLANKLSSSEIQFYSNTSNPSCSKPPVCIGKQVYDISSNSCDDPKCSNYFFTVIDHDSKTCVYNNTAIGFGLFFIVLISLLEFISFFVTQFTASKVAESRGGANNNNTGNGQSFYVDPITIWIGGSLSYVIDGIASCVTKIEQQITSFLFQPFPPAPQRLHQV
mmetsp:Transcript_3150/g.3403  ORF Transcript_3150/g.3403 Transcript_3150/m.3403 type:complete len:537 (+) Transcript_3150:43-1653(+)